MPPKQDRPDCIVVGYNDLDFQASLAGAEAMENYSPIYSEMLRASARFRGRRLPYMDLLNAGLNEATNGDFDFHVFKLPSLGVSYLASFLRRRGLAAEAIQFYNGELDRFVDLLSLRPRSVAITTTFYVDSAPIKDIIETVRKHSPDTKVIVGGPHIYNVCEAVDADTANFVLEEMGAEIYVFDSQGESSLAGAVEALKNGSPDLSRVPNLIYRNGSGFERSERVIEDNDMDGNVVDWSLFDRSVYTPSVQMRTARSCSFKCAFCRYPAVGGALKLNSVDIIEAELKKLKDQGVEQVIFIDDTFNVPLPRFKKLCQMMIKNRFNFRWYSYFRCSNADQEAFDLMAESGCKGTFLGIESGDQTVLDNMNKFAKIPKYVDGIVNLNKRGITTHASFIVGYPGETEQTIRNTIDFINEAKPDFFNCGVFYYDTKAPIAGMADKYGLKGSGFNWKHETMDWKTAREQANRLYRDVEGSLILPTYMFDFWGIPYLLGHGFTAEQIKGFARHARPLLLAGLEDAGADRPDLDDEFVRFFRESGKPKSGIAAA